MAVTKIWPIKDSLKRVVGYAKNPEKTEYQDIKNKFTDLASALRYAADPEKTGQETVFLVTGIHCSEKDPVQDMSLIKRHFGKTGGNVAYHAYQSFRPGEVTPEQCHEIGVRLAKELWGDRFQVLVATHLNCHHLHNHFVINSVSYADGKKFDCNKRTYAEFRQKSDELCREFDLSVVEKPEQKTPRAIHRAIQEGRETRYSLMQDAIQDSLRYASSWEDFCHDLYDEGYEFEPNFDREHTLIRRRGEEKWTRLDHTGYDLDGIEDRIAENDSRGFPCYEDRYEIFRAKNPDIVSKDPLADVEHAFRELSPVLVILAFLLMITTGRDPFRIFKRLLEKEKDLLVPVTPEMRETRTYLVPVSRQAELMVQNHLETEEDCKRFVEESKDRMKELEDERAKAYHRIRRSEGNEQDAWKQTVHEITAQIATHRRNIKDMEKLLSDLPSMEAKVRREMAAIRNHILRYYEVSPKLKKEWDDQIDRGYQTPESLERAYRAYEKTIENDFEQTF